MKPPQIIDKAPMHQEGFAAQFRFIIHSVRFDKEGCCKMTIEVSPQDGPTIAALALQTETRFKADIFIDKTP